MNAASISERADRYWALRFGCSSDLLCTKGVHFVDPPREEMCFVFSNRSSIVVATPASFRGRIAELEPEELLDPNAMRPLLPRGASSLVGPAFVGYSLSFPEPAAALQTLETVGSDAFETLRSELEPVAWAHANLESASPPIYAVLDSDQLVAAAGAETLADRIAHIGVATHPGHRGSGHARKVVSATAWAACGAGLLPQYQTLESNEPAMAVGRSLGFERYATTLSLRWGSAAGG